MHKRLRTQVEGGLEGVLHDRSMCRAKQRQHARRQEQQRALRHRSRVTVPRKRRGRLPTRSSHSQHDPWVSHVSLYKVLIYFFLLCYTNRTQRRFKQQKNTYIKARTLCLILVLGRRLHRAGLFRLRNVRRRDGHGHRHGHRRRWGGSIGALVGSRGRQRHGVRGHGTRLGRRRGAERQ